MASPLDPFDDGPRFGSLEALQRFLEGKDDFEALVALSEGDPLGLDAAIHEWLRAQHLLLDPHQMKAKVLTWLVAWARDPVGPSTLAGLVEDALETVGEELLAQEEQEARAEPDPPEPMPPRFALLARRLGLPPDEVRWANLALNDLPTAQREILHVMLVQGQGFTAFARRRGLTPREARDLSVQALQLLRDRIAELRKRDEEGHDG